MTNQRDAHEIEDCEVRDMNDVADESLATELADQVDQLDETSLENEEQFSSVIQFQRFPFEVLPSALSEFCLAQATSICCDPTMVLVPALATMAAAIGNSRRVQVRNMWSEPAILWTVCVAERGSGKSAAFRAATQPLVNLKMQSELEFEQQLIGCEDRLDDSTDVANASSVTSFDAKWRFRFDAFCESVAVGKLGNCLSGSSGSALVCEELDEWFRRLYDSPKRKKLTEASLLDAYDGRSAMVGCKSNFLFQIGPVALSITGTISQADLKEVLNEERIGSAIAARLLVAMPPEQARHWSDDEVSDEVISRYEQLIFRLARLSNASIETQTAAPISLEMTPQARDRFKNFYNKVGAARGDVEASRMKAALTKVESVAMRIALIIACARFVMGERNREVVEERDVAAGIAAACWFLSETGRIESIFADSLEKSEHRRLAEWIRIQGGSIGVSELRMRRYRYKFGDSAEEALDTLVKMGFGKWKTAATTHQGGRPCRRFWLTSASGKEVSDTSQ